jgi:tetratricopeptide (TPR) repeat protein
MKMQLNQIFSYVKSFIDKNELIHYLMSVLIKKFFFIGNGEDAEFLCTLIKQNSEFENVYAYELELNSNGSSTKSELWTVCHNVNELFQRISIDMKGIDDYLIQLEQQIEAGQITMDTLFPTFGLFNSSLEEKWFHLLTSDSLKFLLFRLCFQVITGMSHDISALDEMCSYCRNQYKLNTVQLQKIDQFQTKFDQNQVIHYYTEHPFIYRLINQAFRSEDIERIFKCRHCITHLHQHLAAQTKELKRIFSQKYVYRGQKWPIVVLQQLQDNVGRIISMNGFLSVSKFSTVGADFACVGTTVDGYESVIFQMEIDKTKILTMTCADISAQSQFEQEGEILFSVGSVWKLKSVNKDTHYWTIELSFYNDVDAQLIEIDQRLMNGFTFLSLANILRELGDQSNSENFYYRMLEIPNLQTKTRGHVHYNLGTLAAEQGRYEDALRHIREAKELILSRKILNNPQETINVLMYSHNQLPSRLRVLNTLGLLYQKKGNYHNAYESFMQALNEEGHELEKAVINNNLGLLEFDYGKYDQSRKHHTEAVKMTKRYVWFKEFKENCDRVNQHISQMQLS